MPEIIPHPFKGEQRIFPLGIESRAAEGAGDRPVVTVVGTDGSEDRHGSVINPNGWDIEPYLRNPVVLWGHQSADIPAIGKTVNLRRSGGQWLFDIEFAVDQWRHMASNLAATTYELMRDGFLNAVSVSFIPKEWKDREAKTIPSFFAENVEYQKQELTEISVVNIGSNRNALQKALEAGRLTPEAARMLGMGEAIRVQMPVIIVGKEAPDTVTRVHEQRNEDATFAIGDRVVVRDGADHGEITAGSAGEIVEIGSHALGIKFDDMPDMVHRWYTAEELDSESADRGKGKKKKKPMSGMDMKAFADFRSQIAAERADFSATREKIAAILRCCGCYPTYEEPEVVELTPEQKRAELDAMTEIVLSLTEAMNDALEAWRNTTRPEMRSYTSSIVLSCMFSIEWLLNRATEWHGATPTVAAPIIDLEEFEREIGNVEMSDENLEIRIRELLALPPLSDEQKRALFHRFEADIADTIRIVAPDNRIRITGIEGSSNAPESQPIRIVATGSAGDGPAAEPLAPSPSLYRVLLSE